MSLNLLTIVGTRPEVIRLSRIIPKLDNLVNQTILHTGQNWDHKLNDIFFQELNIRNPNIVLDTNTNSFGQQLSKIFTGVEQALNAVKPDKVLILGDTNSGLSSILCERYGIPVYHMEAGNRCWDLNVPEEKNRRIIDSIASINMPYTAISRENLLREGFPSNRIFTTGNPIWEIMLHYDQQIMESNILQTLNIMTGDYVLVTAHRAENVDNVERLNNIFSALNMIAVDGPVIFSCHPRTRSKISNLMVDIHPNIKICEPFGFFDFVRLEKSCRMTITDSGTVQEEMCLLGIPTITIRDSTERPETVWCGSNVISGLKTDSIMLCYNRIKNYSGNWTPPVEYTRTDVSDTVINVILSN